MKKWVGRPYFISIKSGLIEISLSQRNYGIVKISLGLRKFHYVVAKFTVPLCWILLILFHWPLFPTSYSFLFFFLFSSCFEILHSRLAEIDIRPYEIDGNQPDFGYY